MSNIASTDLARYAIPEWDRVQYALAAVLMFSGMAARGESNFGTKIYEHLLRAANENGFFEADMLAWYGRHNRCSLLTEQIAAEMIQCIGGHDAVLDICDLYAFKPNDYGALQ